MYEFCYDYVKPKYGRKTKLCYMDTGTFIVYIETDDIYKDIAKDVEPRFEAKFVGLRAETCSEDKKPKSTKNSVIKRKLKFENYKSCLEATQLKNKIKHLENNKININSLKKVIKNS